MGRNPPTLKIQFLFPAQELAQGVGVGTDSAADVSGIFLSKQLHLTTAGSIPLAGTAIQSEVGHSLFIFFFTFQSVVLTF